MQVGSLSVDGELSFNQTTREVNFAKDATIDVNLSFLNNFDISLTALDKVGGIFSFSTDPMGVKFTPNSGDGALRLVLSEDGTTKFDGELNCRAGSLIFGLSGGLSVASGTILDVTINGMTATLKSTGEEPAEIGFDDEKIVLTPGTNSALEISAKFGSVDLGGTINLTNGSIIFDPSTEEITLAKDTELQIDFGDNYTVSLKTTDEAGGKISLVKDGVTFTPNEGDGKLELTVTRDDVTRTTSLEMTGSLIYHLDGSISLAEGTVLKNVFEDGNILTITALTDASGSIIFTPDDGVTITPTEPKALNVQLISDEIKVFDITSIKDGSVNYKGGVITASDGTEVLYTNYYMENEMKLSTKGGSSSLEITEDSTSYIANEGATFILDYQDDTTLEITDGKFIDDYEHAIVTAGSTFKTNDDEDYFYLQTAGDYTLNGMNVATTEDNTPVLLSDYKTITIDGISYTPLDDDVTLTIGEDGATVSGGKVSLQMEGFSQVLSYDTTDGSISYDSTTNKFTIAKGMTTYIENFSDQFVAQGDFDITVEKNSDGTFTFTTDDSAALAIERNGNIIMNTTITLDGSIIADPANNQITVPKDTLLTMSPDDKLKLEITALDDAGGELSLVDGGIRFAPNENDGALELNFVNSERKVQLDVAGAFTYGGLGALSLEDGTEATFTWEDGNKLQLTSSGSTGAIGIDPNKGIKITSNDENLSMKFTSAAGYTTEVSSIQGSLWYKEGIVTIEEGTKLTAKGSIGGQSVDVTLEAQDGDGYLIFGTTGITYGADTGALKITYALDTAKSTFTVNEGSVFIGHDIFTIAEGSSLATDLKNFIPALNFTTSEAGTYTINGQTITTTAEGLKLTATDDYMSFKTSDDVVEYDGMTFAGNGNVSLKPDIVVLGKNVVATGFEEENSFMLAEAGNVTADAKIFQLTKLKNKLGEEIPMNVSVEGAEDGFIFSRTITRESEDNFDDPEYGNVGKIFTERFIVHGDDSYRTRTDPIGLEEVIGISNGATIEGGATLGDKVSPSYYDLVTDTNGEFTIGENTYNIAKGSKVGVVLTARFNGDLAYASAVKNLNGTISGNFSDGGFKVNGNDSLNVYDDTDISIIGSGKNYEILGLDEEASLKVSASGTYNVNKTEIKAEAEDIIVGSENGSAHLYHDNYIENTLSNTFVTGTNDDDYIVNSGTTVTIQGRGGDDYIANNVDSSLVAASLGNSIDAGTGDDTLYSYHSYNPTLLGGEGDDSIVVSHGHLTYIDGGEGNDSILGIAPNDGVHEDYWGMGGHATVLGGDGDDYIDVGYSNDSSLDGGDGNDTIITGGPNATINGGAGENLIQMTATGNELGEYVVLNGQTSVKGFQTGFGEGTDTVYIEDEDPGVDFKKEGLSLYDNDAEKSLTFSDINKTAKLNLYYSNIDWLRKSVFIADDAWYKVSDSDLSVSSGEGVYFVGATAKINHGVDFSRVTTDLNVTINTEYEAENNFVWVNNVHSIIGGAGNTTIAGSEKNDTIIAGSGDTTINVAGGDDLISLSSGAALIEYTVGDGNESIYGFNDNSTLSISGGKYSTSKSGNDLIFTVGNGAITIFGASSANVIGERDIPVEEIMQTVNAKNKVSLSSGNQTLKFNDDGGNLAIVNGNGGNKTIELGNGGDAVAVYADSDSGTSVDVIGGTNSDTLIVMDSAPVTFDMSAGGADKIELIMANQNVTLEGYDPKQGGGIATGNPNRASMVEEIMAGKDTRFGNGKVSLKTSDETQSVFTLAENASPQGSAIINFFDANNKALPVGFTNINGGSLDVSDSDRDYLLIGNYFGNKLGGSTLIGGSGNDTLLGGEGDLLDGGAGNNLVSVSSDGEGSNIVFNGNTTVENFKTGFGNGSDTVYIPGDPAAVDFKSGILTFYGDNDNLTLSGVTTTAKVNLFHEKRDVLNKGVFIAEGDWYKVEESDLTVNAGEEVYFVGPSASPNRGVDFSGISSALNVTIDTAYVDSENYVPTTMWINGVYSIRGGAGLTTITGSDKSDTILAGTGETSIDAGAGNDKLYGNTNADKNVATFHYTAGDGRDSIENFDFMSDAQDVTADKVKFDDNSAITDVFLRGDDVGIRIDGAKEFLMLEDAKGKSFRLNDDLIAKVDTDVEFDGFSNCYVGIGTNSKLTVGKGAGNVEVWLSDDSLEYHGTMYEGNFAVLDASQADGSNILAGNELNNVITGGSGANSLWGGYSNSNDTLIGGAGKNTFFYLQGNGRDTIQNVHDGDEIILDNINLDQIVDANISAAGVNLNFTDGGSLTINGNADVTYQLADGSKYSANHEQLNWIDR